MPHLKHYPQLLSSTANQHSDFNLCHLRLQAKRLEELEKLYREEQVARKRAFNAMEDMKVRSCGVLCIVRKVFRKGGQSLCACCAGKE
jgi:hypothetical protein